MCYLSCHPESLMEIITDERYPKQNRPNNTVLFWIKSLEDFKMTIVCNFKIENESKIMNNDEKKRLFRQSLNKQSCVFQCFCV